jgi:hypothetical protein
MIMSISFSSKIDPKPVNDKRWDCNFLSGGSSYVKKEIDGQRAT